MKSMLVIGMGRFGIHLAKKLISLNNEVMIIDKRKEIIDELAPLFTDAQIGDCRNEAVLRAIGISNFDICFVTIADDFQASLQITSLVKELGAKHVVSKAGSEVQAKLLRKCGADEVIYPKKEMAEKVAIRCSADNIFDYIELTPEYSIFEIPAMENWIGKDIRTLHIRDKFQINILAIKNGMHLQPLPGAEYIFKKNDHILVIGKPADVMKVSSKK